MITQPRISANGKTTKIVHIGAFTNMDNENTEAKTEIVKTHENMKV